LADILNTSSHKFPPIIHQPKLIRPPISPRFNPTATTPLTSPSSWSPGDANRSLIISSPRDESGKTCRTAPVISKNDNMISGYRSFALLLFEVQGARIISWSSIVKLINPFPFPEPAVAWSKGGRMEDHTTEGYSIVLAAIIVGLVAAIALVAWASME